MKATIVWKFYNYTAQRFVSVSKVFERKYFRRNLTFYFLNKFYSHENDGTLRHELIAKPYLYLEKKIIAKRRSDMLRLKPPATVDQVDLCGSRQHAALTIRAIIDPTLQQSFCTKTVSTASCLISIIDNRWLRLSGYMCINLSNILKIRY